MSLVETCGKEVCEDVSGDGYRKDDGRHESLNGLIMVSWRDPAVTSTFRQNLNIRQIGTYGCLFALASP